MIPTAALVAQLRDKLDEREETIRQLREELGATMPAPPALGLTPSLCIIFGVLYRRDIATKDGLMTALYSARMSAAAPPDGAILTSFMCQLRARLRPFGVSIETVPGHGYRMPKESKAVVARMIEEAAGR